MEEDKAVHHGRNEQQNSIFLTPTILSKADAMIEESKEKLYKET